MKKFIVFLVVLLTQGPVWGTEVWPGNIGVTRERVCYWGTCVGSDKASGDVPTIGYTSNCYAYSDSTVQCLYSDHGISVSDNNTYLHNRKVDCVQCKTGYTLKQELDTSWEALNGCSMDAGWEYSTYKCVCDDCGGCKPNTTWQAANTGYERQEVTSTCNTSSCTCAKTYTYRCAAGYYGTPNSNGTKGCDPCPPDSNGYTTTSPAGSTSANACYVQAFKDTAGSGIYPSPTYCHYK